MSPVRAQMCLSKPLPVFFHRWFSCLAFYLPLPSPMNLPPMSSQETGCKPNILVFLARHVIFIQPSDLIHCLYSWQWNNCKKGKPRNLTFLLPIPPRFEHLLKDMDMICNQCHSKTEKSNYHLSEKTSPNIRNVLHTSNVLLPKPPHQSTKMFRFSCFCNCSWA